MRRLIAIGAVALAALGAGAAGGIDTASAAPSRDLFQSPTGNLRCGYVDQTGLMCYSRASGRWAVLVSFQGAGTGRGGASLPGGRVLPYGRTWAVSTFRCRSSRAGMRCWSTYTGSGFFIDRSTAYAF